MDHENDEEAASTDRPLPRFRLSVILVARFLLDLSEYDSQDAVPPSAELSSFAVATRSALGDEEASLGSSV